MNEEKLKHLMELASNIYGTDFWKDIFEQNMMGSYMANGQQQKLNNQNDTMASRPNPPVDSSSKTIGSPQPPNPSNDSSGGQRFPLVDMVKKDGMIIILIDLPGVNKEDVQLMVNQNYLIVKGVSKLRLNDGDADVILYERKHGVFDRHILLPVPTDGSNINAKFHNGILEVSYPIPEQAAGEVIPIE